MKKIGCWIEAMRLRTLPVSVAGVIMAMALAVIDHGFRLSESMLCLVFAVLAQIAANFANEYYDYRSGLDAPGRVGPRRGVTEGDITPRAMLVATYLTLGVACVVGLMIVGSGGLWLLPIGIIIAIGALAYSTGPYPLSRHGFGEVAVIAFFGIAPVTLTYWLQLREVNMMVWLAALAVGLLGANVLLVNNYRDADADKSVGKNTLAVIFGRRVASSLYLLNGIAAMILLWPVWRRLSLWALALPCVYVVCHLLLWTRLIAWRGEP